MINEDEVLEPVGVILTHNAKMGDLIGEHLLKKGGLNNSRKMSVSHTIANIETLEQIMDRVARTLHDVDDKQVIVLFVETNYGHSGEEMIREDLFIKLLEKFLNCKAIIGYSSTDSSLNAASNYLKENYPDIHYVSQSKGLSQIEAIGAIERAVGANPPARVMTM